MPYLSSADHPDTSGAYTRMLPVSLEAELSLYAPAEASTGCLGFQAMESTTGWVPLTLTVHGFLPAPPLLIEP